MTNSATDLPTPVDTAGTPVPGWRWAPAWILAYVALWPAPGYAEGVLVLGAVAALWRLVASRFRGGSRLLSQQAWALTSVLFLSYWLPELVSSIDSVDPGRALRESAVDLRYLPFLWLAASAVADARGRRITFGGLAIIVSVWAIDGLVQALGGASPLFSGMDAVKRAFSDHGMCSAAEMAMVDRLGGVFGPCNLKLGPVLASLSPFPLYALGRRFGGAGWGIGAAVIGLVIVLAGSRASWLTYGLVMLFSGWRLMGWKRLLGVFAFGVLSLVALGVVSPQVRERIERTSQAVEAGREGMDVALSGRPRIWSAALCMTARHPFNGVGARGFREAYPACDPEPGVTPVWGDGPALHAHQIVLEVASETGLFGLLLWLAGVALAWRAWIYADAASRERARPAMLALGVTLFPLNTHLAFYSTFWGGLALLLAALYAGSLLARDTD